MTSGKRRGTIAAVASKKKTKAIGLTSDDFAIVKRKVAEVCGARTDIVADVLTRVVDDILRKRKTEQIANVEAYAHTCANQAKTDLLVREPKRQAALVADPRFLPGYDPAAIRLLVRQAPPSRGFSADPWDFPFRDEDNPRIARFKHRTHREFDEFVASCFYDRVARLALDELAPRLWPIVPTDASPFEQYDVWTKHDVAWQRARWLRDVGSSGGPDDPAHRRLIVRHWTTPGLRIACEPSTDTRRPRGFAAPRVQNLSQLPDGTHQSLSAAELTLVSLLLGSQPIDLVTGVTPQSWDAPPRSRAWEDNVLDDDETRESTTAHEVRERLGHVTPRDVYRAEYELMKKAAQRARDTEK